MRIRNVRRGAALSALALAGCFSTLPKAKVAEPAPGFAQGATITPIEVPRFPYCAADGDGHLWGHRFLDHLFFLDERTLKKEDRRFAAHDLAFLGGSLWSSQSRALGHSTERLDPNNGKELASWPFGGLVRAGSDAVYLLHTNTTRLARIDLATNQITVTAELGEGERLLAVGAGAVWVVSKTSGRVERFDSTTLVRTATLDLLSTPQERSIAGGSFSGIAAGDDGAWITRVGGPKQGLLEHVASDGNSIASTIVLRDSPKTPVIWRGTVWVSEYGSNSTNHFVVRVDPKTNEVVGRLALPDASGWNVTTGGWPDLVAGRDVLWAVGDVVAYRIEVPDVDAPR